MFKNVMFGVFVIIIVVHKYMFMGVYHLLWSYIMK